MLIRRATTNDQAFLWEALYHAIYVEPGTEPPARDIVARPELAKYAEDFGEQGGDAGVIAEDGVRPVGAAWVRLMHGYGFVDDQTPELTIAVLPESQGQGVGTQMLECLFDIVKSDVAQISLSVTWTNPARRLYERLGFELVILEEGTATMRKRL
jgi:ribosomal protein S18 acetylase RimI-like enzyme